MKVYDNVINWLLEDNNFPVQYLTLKHLLHKPDTSPDVRKSKARLMEYSVTRKILSHSNEFWNDDKNAYRKYTGKYWQVIFLGQFLANGIDPQIAEGIQDLLNNRTWVTQSGGQCLTANLLTAFQRLGYGYHSVVINEIEALAQRIIKDKGISCSVMDYSLLLHCYMALPKLLLCFGEIPPDKRSSSVNKAIDLIVRLLLKNEVFIYVPETRKQWLQVLARQPKRANLPIGQTVKSWIAQERTEFIAAHGFGTLTPKQGWLKFGFPLHYNSDIIETLYALSRIGTPLTPVLHNALHVVRNKMSEQGTWNLESSLNGKMFIDIEKKGQPSKWITYFALYVLNHFKGNI